MTERSFIVDDDLFEAGIDSYVQSGGAGGNIWRLSSKGGPKKGYFITNPFSDEAKAINDWLTYREISAFDGLRGGIDMPNGLKEFPVFDTQVVIEDGQRRRTTNSSLDPVIALIVPGKFGQNGKAKAGDMIAFNFLEEITDDDGNTVHKHIILKMSGQRGRELQSAYKLQVETQGSFDLTAYPWTLGIVGQGAASSLKLKPHRAEGPTDSEVEPIDVLAAMTAIREAVDEFVETIRGGGTASTPDTLPASSGDDDATSVFEAAVEEPTAAELDDADKWSAMSDAELRKALKAGNVTVPPKAARTALISLAMVNL